MNQKNNKNKLSLFLLVALFVFSVYSVYLRLQLKSLSLSKNEISQSKTKAIMMLIEYQDTAGLVNFVNDLDSRGIHSLLSASPEFVEDNCQTIKTLLNHKMQIVSQNPSGSFWGLPYEEQLEAIKDAKNRIETCTGQPLRVISSRYFASDENTVKVASQLGIPYVLARGVKGTEAVVFQPEEYPDVKILSVSNIPTLEFEYGSLCDYSYWVRQGSPDDMLAELEAGLSNKKITPVSHTNIGGYKQRWHDMWLKFLDNDKLDWLPLDEYATVDITLPMWQIPRNKNAPYTPEKRPEIPYDQEMDVSNPCSAQDLEVTSTDGSDSTDLDPQNNIVMFHNGQGPMCQEAMDFLKNINFPNQQILTSQVDFTKKLDTFKKQYSSSLGVSTSFSYYPIIFIKDKAFSGFDKDIQSQIEALIK